MKTRESSRFRTSTAQARYRPVSAATASDSASKILTAPRRPLLLAPNWWEVPPVRGRRISRGWSNPSPSRGGAHPAASTSSRKGGGGPGWPVTQRRWRRAAASAGSRRATSTTSVVSRAAYPPGEPLLSYARGKGADASAYPVGSMGRAVGSFGCAADRIASIVGSFLTTMVRLSRTGRIMAARMRQGAMAPSTVHDSRRITWQEDRSMSRRSRLQEDRCGDRSGDEPSDRGERPDTPT